MSDTTDAFQINDSEKGCPVMHGPERRQHRGGLDGQRTLVAEPAQPANAAPELAGVEPARRRLRLRRGVRRPRLRRAQGRPHRPDDRLAGLVARRLRPLRPAVHPHGLAQRRHLPHRRRPRRWRQRHAAIRPAQQLAGQRQPRQGAHAAAADQAEVRQQDLVGRPDAARRQRGDGVDGAEDVRLRRRPRRRLRSRGGHLLGSRDRVARRRALPRRPRTREPARRRPDGPDLRQPRRPQRQPRPAGVGSRHPRDVRPHGDERRGDRGARRRRSHLRQGARRR